MNQLTICNIQVRQDKDDRFCLNDLHKAAGAENKHRPSLWLENQQAKELIEEIQKAGIPAIKSKQRVGTFAVKELVYAYAMWISAKFHLHVIRAYDEIVVNELKKAKLKKDPEWSYIRDDTKSGNVMVCDTLKEIREELGKATKAHHYCNEQRMMNWAITGKFEPLKRESLTSFELKILSTIQRKNMIMIARGFSYSDRRKVIQQIADSMKAQNLLLH